MTGPEPAFPDSRTLTAWWKQLVPLQPDSLAVGFLLWHRIEALVSVRRPSRLDPLDSHLLQALALHGPLDIEQIDQHFHLGQAFLGQILRALQADGLARPDPQGQWQPTARGQQATSSGTLERTSQQRRVFHFLESDVPGSPPLFVNLQNSADAIPFQPGNDWKFDAGLLQACVDRSPDWKRSHEFPVDIDAAIGQGAAASMPEQAPSWQRVMVDQALQMTVLLATTPQADRVLGFAVNRATGKLGDKPAFTLSPDALAGLTPAPSAAGWLQAWHDWGQKSGLVGIRGETRGVQVEGAALSVTVSARLMERLRAYHPDTVRGTAWLLAGTGRIRPACRLQIKSDDSELARR